MNYKDEGYETCPRHLGLNINATSFVPGTINRKKIITFKPNLETIHEVEENAGFAEYLKYIERNINAI